MVEEIGIVGMFKGRKGLPVGSVLACLPLGDLVLLPCYRLLVVDLINEVEIDKYDCGKNGNRPSCNHVGYILHGVGSVKEPVPDAIN